MCKWYYIQICILHSTGWQKGSSLHRGKDLSHPSPDSSENWWFGLFAAFHAQFERLKGKIIFTSFTQNIFLTRWVIIPGYSFSISLGFGPRLMPHSHQLNMFLKYRKIPKMSPGAYIFQRAFLRGLFLEGLIFGRAYLRRLNLRFKIDWASLIVKGYHKIPKISPGAYIFQRPFLRGLFLEGRTFRGAYVRRKICVSISIGLACRGKEIYHFCFVLLCIRGQIPSTSTPGGLYSEGRFNGGSFALRLWGAYIWRG